MSGRKIGTILFVLGIGVLLSNWAHVADWTESVVRQEEMRPHRVVYWTSSGSPEVDLQRARQFMELNPDVSVTPNFRATEGLQDLLFISFLSGNPPDYMGVRVNELRKYALIGGLRPLDDLLAADNERLRQERIAAGEDPQDIPDEPYFDQFLIGDARIHRFSVNPDDYFIRNYRQYPEQAARLLAMHGKAVAIRGVDMPDTLTYNKRLFREAAGAFPEYRHILLDEHGEARPPVTWAEFHEVARIITEYGRRAAEQQGRAEPICYGVVIQGQENRDIMRGIRPLARRAGSVAFDYAGSTEQVHQHFRNAETRSRYEGQPIGFFDYHNDAWIAAFGLLTKMRQDGLVLPGTEARDYESVRTALAEGNAAMLIDGWHAALIGAERVPWAAQDLGSAPIPMPFPPVDPDSGWTSERVAQERRRLEDLLELRQAGLSLSPGTRIPRTSGDNVEMMTSLARSPQAAWDWMHFTSSNPDILRAECRRGSVPQERLAIQHLGDPDWFPYRYQAQVYGIIQNHSEMWPERPLHGPVQQVAQDMDVYYKYFHQARAGESIAQMMRRAREEVRPFTEAANRDLARRIEQGVTRPEEWTFADFDPQRAGEFFDRQQDAAASPEAEVALAAAHQQVLDYLRSNPELGLTEGGNIRADIWTYHAPTSRYQVLWIPTLMLGVAMGWLTWTIAGNLRRRQPALGDTLRGARRGWHGYAFVLPGMLAIFTFAIYPSLYQFYLAAHSGDGLGVMQYVGAQNYARLLNPWHESFDRTFWTKVVPNTLLYTFVVMAGHLVIGLFLASLLNLPLKANRVYRVLFFIPLVTSLAIVSVILIGLLKGEPSVVNNFLFAHGLENFWHWVGMAKEPGQRVDLLGQEYGLFTIMGVGIWHGLPFNIILLLAGLQSISPELYEAARVDGAGAWKRFTHVTIPELAPILIIIAFNAFIGAAKAFGVAFVLTKGGIEHSSELVSTYIFKYGFMKPEGQEADLGYASALGIVYSFMLAGLTITNVVIIARRWKRRLANERQAAAAS